ncbi:MAG: DUF1326 domain-containing protein, partial [Phycisphaerae bacterium]|nr:DUF1326 domain-containing protein [Phycisphaerae bacterium]
AFDVQEGNADGVAMKGAKIALIALWPANFFEGNGKARLYLDEAASAEQ